MSPLARRTFVQVYHFVGAKHGLDDLHRRRLKIATLDQLNDPFELLAVDLSDAGLRHAFKVMKTTLGTHRGLLCFSKRWSNPVQWSHYAEKHAGLCLGFDVPDALLGEINYSGKRLVTEVGQFLHTHDIDEGTAKRFLFTKYAHWRYETEIRCFVNLEDRDPETGLYFADFSDQLKLKKVIVGAASAISRSEIEDTLGDIRQNVEVFKARLSFKYFKVVRQENGELWDIKYQ